MGGGVIDRDFRGEVKVILFNHGPEECQVRHGDRLAQLIVEQIVEVSVREVKELKRSQRGDRGFGSTEEDSQERVPHDTREFSRGSSSMVPTSQIGGSTSLNHAREGSTTIFAKGIVDPWMGRWDGNRQIEMQRMLLEHTGLSTWDALTEGVLQLIKDAPVPPDVDSWWCRESHVGRRVMVRRHSTWRRKLYDFETNSGLTQGSWKPRRLTLALFDDSTKAIVADFRSGRASQFLDRSWIGFTLFLER